MTIEAKPPRSARRYHHGSLKEAMLTAAERILQEEGIEALTLRRAAREAEASHAAPKNHFGDMAGLLSELAALGFRKIGAAIARETSGARAESARISGLSRGYIAFARENPALFLLMFRSGRLDHENPTLKEAVGGAFRALTLAVVGRSADEDGVEFTLLEAARIANAWARVHGLAMLMIDGQLSRLRTSDRPDDEDLIEATLTLKV